MSYLFESKIYIYNYRELLVEKFTYYQLISTK